MNCRKALAELHHRKLIALPPSGKNAVNTRHAQKPVLPAPFNLNCSLSELGPIELLPVYSLTSENSRIWRDLFDSYHYLGSGQLCGAQLRYLIWSQRFGWLGGLSFSASAFKLRCRDEFISWGEEAHSHNLQKVVCNSRFLIVPTIKVPGLASHVLSQCCKRLADDWEKYYSYRPVLLETFIERGRFSGTCYRAANWQHVGVTAGRGRQDTEIITKDVYVYPLCDDWKSILCSLPDRTFSTRLKVPEYEPANWLEEEFKDAELGDRRLVNRLIQIGDAFFSNPTANVPQTCTGWPATKAAYRFFDHNEVSMEKIFAPHYKATEQRLRNHSLVLVAQDTSTLNYSHHPEKSGLGPINTQKDKSIGLLLHDTMAFTPDGLPLGLLDVQVWARDPDEAGKRDKRHTTPIEEKESFKWIKSYHNVCDVQARCPETRLIVMADREADIHELFTEHVTTPNSAELLIRAEKSRNRNIKDEEEQIQSLWPFMEAMKPASVIELTVPPKKGQLPRIARLEVRFSPVTLKAPRRKNKLPDVFIHAVQVKEIDAPQDVKEPLEWMLLSTIPVTNLEEAQTATARYAKRWGIEIYHRVLKSGCRIEDRQLGTARRLENCLAIDMVVAWRIHYLTWLGRETPELPCTVFFEEAEWKALVGFIKQSPVVPDKPPTLREALIMVATLGGFLNRKSDGEPGTVTVWRGMQRLEDITRAYIAFVLRPPPTSAPSSSKPTYG